MSSTRYQRQPMQIYQDPETYDRAPMPSMNSTAKKAVSPLRPIKNASTRRNVIFNPPSSAPSKPSPLKPSPQNSSSPTNAHYHSKLNMISMPPPNGPSYNTDSMEKKNLGNSKFSTVPQKALFTTFSSARQAGKENYHPIYPAPPGYNDGIALGNFNLDVNQGIYGQKSQGKRALLEATSIPDSRAIKKVKVEAEPLVSVKDQLPSVHDDGTKPGHSYAQLIGIAILSAPNRRLTLAQIYKWISDTYKYYNASDAGWQNSIRHNLSLNKAFVKQERPKDDPGKGSYWAIEQGMEGQFYKDKPSRKSTSANENITVLSSAAAPSIAHEPVNPPSRASFPTSDLPQSSLFAAPESEVSPQELSSDATIPASDAPEEEHDEEERYNGPPSSQPILSSPLNEVRSSPPVHHVHTRRSDTPPPVPRFPPSSRNKSSHKRGFASMDDSGYFSSLSSGLRGHGSNHLTSDIDRPRIKRGRAEEEIARLRGSSYDSPTKPRSLHHGHSLVPDLSSPLRRPTQRHQSNQMLPPLTPAVKLKPPQRPPPSVSPNTNLKLHRDRVRQLVGSPERGMASLDENFSWSPAFRIDDSYMNINYEAEFDIFADAPDLLSIPGNGSPEKRSAKRMRVDRSHSANILSDISITKCNTNTNRNITSAPLLDFTSTPMLQPSAFPSPSKFFMPSSPNKMRLPALDINSFDLPQEDFFGAEFLVDEMTEFSGLDIMQGFQKIGAGGQHGRSGSTTKGQNVRPPVGRSFTSRF